MSRNDRNRLNSIYCKKAWIYYEICDLKFLYFYFLQVAWVRVDTQTILSIHHNVITQNPRISLSYNDHRSWYLHIKNVQESDRGWYMCQINTDPMRSRQGYLQVVGQYLTPLSSFHPTIFSWTNNCTAWTTKISVMSFMQYVCSNGKLSIFDP